MKNYDAVVFDMDGVIFDSERAIMECWIEQAEKMGMEYMEEHFHACIGVNIQKTREIMPVIRRLTEAGLLEYFDEIVTGDMVTHSKPHPEIYLVACEKIGVKPEDAVAIEDSYNGIRSATSGGLRTIMVPDLLPANDEMKELAETVLDDLNDVIEYLDKM